MGSKQLGFGDVEQTTAKKRTKREKFLAGMEKVLPWKALIDLIEPHYPKSSSKGGRPAHPPARSTTLQWPSSCCAKGTPTSIEIEMGWLARRFADRHREP